MGRPELNFYASFSVLMLNLGLNFYLIPKFGITGAAIATTISFVVNLVVRLIIFGGKAFEFPMLALVPKLEDLQYLRRLAYRKIVG